MQKKLFAWKKISYLNVHVILKSENVFKFNSQISILMLFIVIRWKRVTITLFVFSGRNEVMRVRKQWQYSKFWGIFFFTLHEQWK